MALGACGPERMHYGAPRDFVLGLRFLNGHGRIISTGGKVVKNVAGYDMTRLMIGSAGTLGLITEVTCRVMTVPERCTAIRVEGTLPGCSALASELITSRLTPVFVVMIPENGQSGEIARRRCIMEIGFEGFDKTVDEQLKRIRILFEKNGLILKYQQDYSVQDGIFKDIYTELAQSSFILRADLPLDQGVGFIQSVDERLLEPKLFLDYGCGRIYAGFETMPDGVWGQLCDLGNQMGGHVVMEKATVEFKEHNDVFGFDRPEWKVMHRIKDSLDPLHIFAPGRLPGKV
jgi:FAD/FMN-containing dehydrogenase